MGHVDLGNYLLLAVALLLVLGVAIVLQVSMISGRGIGETIRDLWKTYFGKGDGDPEA